MSIFADPSEDARLARAWLDAAADAAVGAELGAIYGEVGAAIAARGPVCRASGRCCNFESHGHRLYVTGLEAAYTVSRLDRAGPLTGGAVAEARARGGCPFQVQNLCAVHTIKPLGCRVYYCDPTAREWQQDLAERMQVRIRGVHDRWGVEYRYAEWRAMLGLFARPGEAPGDAPAAAPAGVRHALPVIAAMRA